MLIIVVHATFLVFVTIFSLTTTLQAVGGCLQISWDLLCKLQPL